ncbi:MAG: lipid-A-disaccharide synthase [Alphaproteobacteria bacterium]|nr:lipid-A-disaccharide synthase [Alphaproteobacteria bacterium]
MVTALIVAGEPSGDLLGAALMNALRRQVPTIRFLGVGGPQMAAEGLVSAVPMSDLAVMGLAEVLPRLPRILQHLRTVAALARRERPDVVVTIDSPGFNFRLARRLNDLGCPLVHYVAPTVWAWRPERAAKMAPLFDHLLTLLPFEPPFFEREGLPATFVGHPVLERAAGGDGRAFRRRHGIAPEATVLSVLPGSRMSEVTRLLPRFDAALDELRRHQALEVVVPTVATVAARVRAAVAVWPAARVIEEEQDKRDAMAASEAALVASGTASLELAVADVPMVVAYRLNPLTHRLVRRLVRVKYASLVNLLIDAPAIPELLQDDCTPDRLARALGELLGSEAARDRQRQAFAAALARLQPPGATSASGAAAQTVLLAIAKGRRPRARFS